MRQRKGVVLAGGSGTRLRPLTFVANKHLLPVYDKPMVMYPIGILKSLGIKDICIVTGKEHLSSFRNFLGDGTQLGVSFVYRGQEGPKGIADALRQARSFFKKDKAIVILGDVIFDRMDVPKKAFEDNYAYVFIKEVKNRKLLSKQGVVVFDKQGNIIDIEEKPKVPKSRYIVAGLYIYPNDVFDFIEKVQKPSARGELEVTDINTWYLKTGRLKYVKMKSFWADAGTFQSLLKVSMMRARTLGVKMDNSDKEVKLGLHE
jgi:glucose-1-phosphate thymidylyltransferase